MPDPTMASLDPWEPEEVADLSRRRRFNFGLVGLALALPLLAGLVVGYRAAWHTFGTFWLKSHHYKVDWSIDATNRTLGGSTHVKGGTWANSMDGNHPAMALVYLPKLHRVESLDLALPLGLRDADLLVLSRLTDLTSLNLDRRGWAWNYSTDEKLTDQTLDSIRGLARLRELYLGGQGVTDAGLANLAGLQALQSLDLRATAVTDAGLVHLVGLKSLKSLDLTGTKVTAQGVLGLEAARPGLKVMADHLPTPSSTPK